MPHVMIVDDEKSIRLTLGKFLVDQGYTVEVAEDAEQAQTLLSTGAWDVVVADIVLPGHSGVDLLKIIRAAAPSVQVIMMTGEPTIQTAAEAVRSGARDYLTKPVPKNAIIRSVATAVRIKQLEEEKRRMAKAILDAQQEQLRLKDDFLSHVSHELRTPLAAIDQFVTILLDGLAGAITDEQREYLGIAHRNAGRLRDMIEDLLQVTRTQAGKVPIEPRELALLPVLGEVEETLRPTVAEQGLTLKIEAAAELPTVCADPQRVRQILLNLVSNAIKFTPPGGQICVSAKLTNVEVGTRSAEGMDQPRKLECETPSESLCPSSIPHSALRVPRLDASAIRNPQSAIEVSVRDTGCGISAEDCERIFGHFYQVENTLGQSRKGLGLGLFICNDLTTRQGGRLWVESELGQGATFHFTLPLFAPEPAPISPVASDGRASGDVSTVE